MIETSGGTWQGAPEPPSGDLSGLRVIGDLMVNTIGAELSAAPKITGDKGMRAFGVPRW